MMFENIKTLTTMCPECEIERRVQYGARQETVNIKKEKIDVVTKVFYCPEGNHFFSNLEDDEEKSQYVYREYRKRKNLLQPEEVEQIRKKYELSQTAFSIFLGFGVKTIHRYETGAIPDDPHNSFIKLIKDAENFKKHFENVKDKLPINLKLKIEKRLVKLEEVEKQPTLPYRYTEYQVALSSYSDHYLTATQAIASREYPDTHWLTHGFQVTSTMLTATSSEQIESIDEVKITDVGNKELARAA